MYHTTSHITSHTTSDTTSHITSDTTSVKRIRKEDSVNLGREKWGFVNYRYPTHLLFYYLIINMSLISGRAF